MQRDAEILQRLRELADKLDEFDNLMDERAELWAEGRVRQIPETVLATASRVALVTVRQTRRRRRQRKRLAS